MLVWIQLSQTTELAIFQALLRTGVAASNLGVAVVLWVGHTAVSSDVVHEEDSGLTIRLD